MSISGLMTSHRGKISFVVSFAVTISMAVVVFALHKPVPPPVPGATGAHDLYYDAAGRLAGVSDPNGYAARYHYDATGNLLSTERFRSDELSIMTTVPAMAPPGATVEISGTDFGDPLGRRVWFTGASEPAQEVSAEPNRLRVTVPDDATDGPITLSTSHGETTTAESFLVGRSHHSPTITKLSDTAVDPGDRLTITGTNFDTGEYRTSVQFHRTQAQVVSVDESSVTVEVPESAGSGPVSVRTPDGLATTDFDVVVAPREFAVNRLVDGGRLDRDGASSTATIGAGRDGALFRFAGKAGDRLSLGISGGTNFSQAAVLAYTPYVGAFARLDFDTPQWLEENGTGGFPLPELPTDGIYQVIVAPQEGGGEVTATLSTTRSTATSTGGDAVDLSLDRPGRFVELTFDAEEGEWIDLGFSGVNPRLALPYVVFEPHGSQVANSLVPQPAGRDVDDAEPRATTRFQAFAAGTYRVQVCVADGGSAEGSAWVSSERDGGALELGGTAVAVALDRPGQATRFTFTGDEDQSLTAALTDIEVDDAAKLAVQVFGPDGEEIGAKRSGDNVAIEALPADGDYTLVLSGGPATGSATIGLSESTTHHDVTTVDESEDSPADPGWRPDDGNLAGHGWNSGYGEAPYDASELTAADGVTAATGRVLTIAGKPLEGVTVSADGVTDTTDAKGRFLLPGIDPGRRVLHVDGGTADGYAAFEIGVDVPTGGTYRLPYSVFLPKIDTDTIVKVDSPTTEDVTLTTPAIPGLEVRIPEGTVIRDADGEVVDELSMTAIPLDRPPFPLPTAQVPVYFTVQPGDGYLFPEGAQVVYPNYTDQAPGTRMDFWAYDPEGVGWHRYGGGEVSADGSQVVPDPDVKFYRFTGAMTKVADKPPPQASPNDGPPPTGDPVDPSTGLMVSRTTDLFLDDVLPIELTRVYQQGDTAVREFGVGTNFSYDYYPWSPGQIEEFEYEEADLYAPTGATTHFDRTSPGEGLGGFASAVFEAEDTPTEFAESSMTWNGHGWDVHMRDGTTYVLGDESPLQAVRDQYGNTITIDRELKSPGYSADGYQITPRPYGPVHQITSPNGKWIRFTYNDERPQQVERITDHLGREVSYQYDSHGRLTAVTDPDGAVTKYTYTGDGLLKSIVDASGETYLTNHYDSHDRVTKQDIADQGSYRWDYDGGSDGTATATTVTDPNGTEQRFAFNAEGQVTGRTFALGTEQEQSYDYEYDDSGVLTTAVVDPLGRRTEYRYDEAGLVVGVTYNAGTEAAREETVVRDGPYGAVTEYTDVYGATSRFGYDEHGGIVSITDPLGRSSSLERDEHGQVVAVTDAAGGTSTVEYLNGDPVATTGPDGATGRVGYDAAGRPISVMDARHAVTSIEYDSRDQVTAVTDPLGATTKLEYDALGNQTAVLDPLGHTTRVEYNAIGLPVTVTDPLGGVTALEYDGNANLTRRTSPADVVTTVEYDPLDRPTTIRYGVTENDEQSSTAYEYDELGRLTAQRDSVSGDQTYGYDLFDRVVSESSALGEVTYAYDPDDGSRSVAVDGEPIATYRYDDAGALIGADRDGESLAAIGYDDAGRVDTVGGDINQRYHYDASGRVAAIGYQQGDSEFGRIAYTYDADGRPVHVAGNNAGVMIPEEFGPADYDAADRMIRLGDKEISYDADGNLVDDGSTQYSWDARGQLTAMTGDGTDARFGYDADGRRVDRTVDGTTTEVLYDGLNPVREFTDGELSATQISGGVDRFLVRETEFDDYRYLTDLTGSTRLLATDDGRLPTSYAYEPYGNPAIGGQDPGANPYQFTGRENDGTGLMQYRSRYYSPESGRFVSSDPIGFAGGGTNLYNYVLNQPTVYTDPMGTDPQAPPGNAEDPCPTPNSFTGDTEVVMADGSRKPIAEVERGEEVLATDPLTGETQAREVTDLIEGQGDKELTEVTVDTDEDGAGDSTVTATDGHPFWVASDAAWRDAKDLKPGDLLRTSAGTYQQVTAVSHRTEATRVHNLTVDGLHSYYVATGDGDVLVHNCGGPDGDVYGRLRPAGPGNEIHHMPQNASTSISHYSGPAIRMLRSHHRALLSTGSSEPSKAWLMMQRELVQTGRIDRALMNEIYDVTTRFPHIYNNRIGDMIGALSSNPQYQVIRTVPSDVWVQLTLW